MRIRFDGGDQLSHVVQENFRLYLLRERLDALTELRIRRAVEGVADPLEAERIADRLTAESLEQLEDLKRRVEAERITLPPLTRENWRRRCRGGLAHGR